jgi:tungstate transport system substrate-binding protein
VGKLKRNKLIIAVMILTMFVLNLFPALAGAAAVEDSMILATTTSTQDSGLLDVLIPAFEKEYSTKVK